MRVLIAIMSIVHFTLIIILTGFSSVALIQNEYQSSTASSLIAILLFLIHDSLEKRGSEDG